MGEAVGEVSEGPATLGELGFQVGPERAGLDAGEPRVGVDVDDTVEAAEVERDDGSGLGDMRLEAARDVAAAAERDDHGILGHRCRDDRLHLALVCRVDHDIRRAPDLVGADAHQVAQALAVRVHDAFHRRGADVLLAHGGRELGEERRGSTAVGEGDLVERGLFGELGRVQIEADRLQHEGRETGLVLVVEPDALDAPAPPLHVLDVAHACAPSLAFDAPRIRSAWASRRRTISARMRDVKSPTLSPSACFSGVPKTTPTGRRPGFGHFDPRGCAMPAPIRATGTHGTPVAAASEAAPDLKVPEFAVARTGALGEDEQRHPLLQQHLGADASRVRAGLGRRGKR